MGQNSSAHEADEVKRLQTALAHAATNESILKSEIETLKTSLTHALSSEREMRASARDTREEWERVERALREEIGVLRVGLVDTEKTLAKVKKELQGKKVVPFVQRLIKGKGRLVEEMITLEEPPQNVCAEVDEECVTSFSGWLPPRSRILIITSRSLEGSSEIHVLFDGLALHHFEQHDPFSVQKTGQSAFRTKMAPDLAVLERATAGLQRAVNAELRSAHAKTSLTGSSTSIPRTARNLRLLVVLWEEGGKEKLMSSLMSVVEERGPKMYTGDCLICTEPLTREETVSVEGCGHTTCKDCLRQHITSRLGERVWPILCPICVAERGSQRKAQGMVAHSTHVVQGHILKYFTVITRLLVDELALPPLVLSQWTDFELSQFVVPVACPKSALFSSFKYLPYTLFLPGVPSQTYLNYSTTTGPISSSARMAASVPGAVTARGG